MKRLSNDISGSRKLKTNGSINGIYSKIANNNSRL
jgi:hypothetical protein